MYKGVSQLLQQVSRSREGPLTEVSQMCERPGRLADLLHWPAPGAAWVPPGAAWVPPGCRLVPPGAAWCLACMKLTRRHQAVSWEVPLFWKAHRACRRLGQGAQGSWEISSCLPEILKLSELFLLGMSPVKAVPIELCCF